MTYHALTLSAVIVVHHLPYYIYYYQTLHSSLFCQLCFANYILHTIILCLQNYRHHATFISICFFHIKFKYIFLVGCTNSVHTRFFMKTSHVSKDLILSFGSNMFYVFIIDMNYCDTRHGEMSLLFLNGKFILSKYKCLVNVALSLRNLFYCP